jgi:hypothetical protein
MSRKYTSSPPCTSIDVEGLLYLLPHIITDLIDPTKLRNVNLQKKREPNVSYSYESVKWLGL